jgi:hypothetical protein
MISGNENLVKDIFDVNIDPKELIHAFEHNIIDKLQSFFLEISI